MSLEQTKQALMGEWVSLAPEIRPSATKNPDGSLRPFYLTRNFKYLGNDRFELTIVNTADPYGKAPVARIYLRGHMLWKGDHPIAAGAQKVDFVADEDYQVTPLAQLSPTCSTGSLEPYIPNGKSNQPQKVFGKAFAPFGLAEGRNFMEYDLVYSTAACCSGCAQYRRRGFDKEENRPTNLQIPLVPKVAGR